MQRAALLLPARSTVVRWQQRRWAQVHNVRFFAAQQPAAHVQEKYRQKLEQKAREHGLKDADALREAYSDKIQELRNKAIVPGGNAPLDWDAQSATSSAPPPSHPPSPLDAAQSVPFQPPPPPQPVKSSPSPVKTLGSFIDVAKTALLPAKEISTIWRLRHARDANSLCAVLPAATYRQLLATARQHPQFVLPIPREGQGAEIHFLQWTFPSPTTVTVLFTGLAEFKLRGEYASPHTTITHHTDLVESNELVLLEGRVMEDRGVTVDEGKWLLMCLQKFYAFQPVAEGEGAAASVSDQNAQRRRKLMQQFSSGDAAFSIEELLDEAEKIP